MSVQEIQGWIQHLSDQVSTQAAQVPGYSIVHRYIRSSYQNDPVRSVIEFFLVIFAIRYLLAPSYSTKKKGQVKLSEEEIDDLIDHWTPEPLVAASTYFEEAETVKNHTIQGPSGPKVKLTNGRTVINLASYNYYNLNTNDEMKEKAIQTLRTYGVGPCGPPNFYGTQDVHMKTEADIAAHIGTEKAIIYAQAFQAISSVIPSFCKRGDIIVADHAVNYAIRKGLQISRSTVRWYKHNDMEDLERVLAKVVKDHQRKPLTRRFIVTEGLFEDVGDMSDLPKIIELKYKYKFRLMLDETWSYGVLGRTGRGLTEQQNVDAHEVDFIVGSMAGHLCGAGGFCAASRHAVAHQRIAASAYTFSAALPAMAATCASEAILRIQSDPALLAQSRENTKAMRAQLDPRSDWVACTSAPENPCLLLGLKPEIVSGRNLTAHEQEVLLQDVVDECLTQGVMITRRKGLPRKQGKEESWEALPALKVCVTTGLSEKEITKAGTTIRHAITKVMRQRKST